VGRAPPAPTAAPHQRLLCSGSPPVHNRRTDVFFALPPPLLPTRRPPLPLHRLHRALTDVSVPPQMDLPDDEQGAGVEQEQEQEQGAELRRTRLVVNTEPDERRPLLEFDKLKNRTGAPDPETRRPLIRPSGIDPGNPRHRQMLVDNDRATGEPPSRKHLEAQRMAERVRSEMEKGASLQQAISRATEVEGSIPVRPLSPTEPTLTVAFTVSDPVLNDMPPEDVD